MNAPFLARQDNPPEKIQVLIVGGGPAGMGAAIEARRFGLSVILIEERQTLGGQIFKRMPESFVLSGSSHGRDYDNGSRLIAECQASGARVLLGATVWGIWGRMAAIETDDGSPMLVEADRIILAPGAYDRPVAFEGWTLPGVVTAGGIQSLVKAQRVDPGDRVIMAGTGPLPLAFASQIRKFGVNVTDVVEAAQRPGLRTVLALLSASRGNLDLLREGIAHLSYLRRQGVTLHYGRIVLRAEGKDRLERVVTVAIDSEWRPVPGSEIAFDAQTLCVGYGLFPSSELAAQAGCVMTYDEAFGGWIPQRDENMRSSVGHIFVVGDGAGIRGSKVAVENGRLAGLTAARDLGALTAADLEDAALPIRRRAALRECFQTVLKVLYPVRRGIYALATDRTIVCRCEEVSLGDLKAAGLGCGASAQDLKTRTRAGMGLCQGRNCSRQVAALVAAEEGCPIEDIPRFAPRAPVKLVTIGAVAQDMPENDHVDLFF